MGHADEQDETEGILQELESFEEKHPGESELLLEALRRIWDAAAKPERIRLEGFTERCSEFSHLADFLERYERVCRQLDKLREGLESSSRETEASKREYLDAVLKEAATHRSPTLQEILDAHEGPRVRDVADLRPAWEGEGDGLEVLRDLLEMRRANRDRERAREA